MVEHKKNNIAERTDTKSVIRKKNPKIKPYWTIFLILLAVFLIGATITFFYYTNYVLLDYKEINTTAKIIPYGVGINADPGGLYYGKTAPGGSAIRSFTLISKKQAMVRIVPQGNIAPLLYLPENNFILDPNVTKLVYVVLQVPKDAKIGNYSGIVKVYLLKP